MQTINVSSKSSTGVLSEVILQHLSDYGEVMLKAIGAGAVNQAAKGIAVAEQSCGTHLQTHILFFNAIIANTEKSGLVFEVKKGD